MWWLADPLDLHRVSDRVSTVYVERCHVDRADNAVVFVNRERTVRLPAAFVSAVLLGPGTRITHQAVRLLADSGTSLCWVGEHGVRMYAAGLGPSRGSSLAERQAYLVSRPSERLQVARTMYSMRFTGEDVSKANMQQLRGREGVRIRRLYRQLSDEYGVEWKGRHYKPGDAFAEGDDVNRLLSAGHACLYGVCHAAVVGVGAIPSLGFVHTGGAMSFVLDIADLYKAEFIIPLAFQLARDGRVDESDMRHAARDSFSDGQLMKRVVRDIQTLLQASVDSENQTDEHLLWDESGTVSGGRDWSTEHEDLKILEKTGYLAISGPVIPEPVTVDW